MHRGMPMMPHSEAARAGVENLTKYVQTEYTWIYIISIKESYFILVWIKNCKAFKGMVN